MITLNGHSDQLQASAELATRQESRTEKKTDRTPESGFDVLFSALAAAQQMNPALQQHSGPAETDEYEPRSAPDDRVRADNAVSRKHDRADSARSETDAEPPAESATETAPAQNAQPSQVGTQTPGSANVPSNSAQTTENPAIAQAVQAGIPGNASQNAPAATESAFENTLSLISQADPAQSAIQAQPAQATPTKLPDAVNAEPKERADAVFAKQGPAMQPDPLRDQKVTPFAKDLPAQLPITSEGTQETKSVQTQASVSIPTPPVEPKITNQISEARNEAAFKELISAIKVAVTAGSTSQDTSSFTPGFGENTDSGPAFQTILPAQEENSFSQLLNRNATQLTLPAGAGDSAQIRTGQRTESIAPPLRGLDALDTMVSKASLTRDGNQLALTLKPEGLGKLDINISLEKGMLHAQIQASDPAAKQLIENNLQQIVNTLMQEGLTVSGFSVSLRQGAPENGNGSGLNAFQNQPEKAFEAPVVGHMHDQNRLISIFV